MANYSYTKETPSNLASWIDHLQRLTKVTDASAHYTEIHFTVPKATVVSTMTQCHVTFVRQASSGASPVRSHWYVTVSNDKYTLTLNGEALDGESEIASKVLDDAQSLNWIKPVPPKVLTKQATDGGADWTETESKKKKKDRRRNIVNPTALVSGS